MTELEKRKEFIEGLRTLALLYETNSELELPSTVNARVGFYGYGENEKERWLTTADILQPDPSDIEKEKVYTKFTVNFGTTLSVLVTAKTEMITEKTIVGMEPRFEYQTQYHPITEGDDNGQAQVNQ